MSEKHAPRRRRGRPKGGASDTRDRIVAAATDEFAEQGYDGATVRAIAARAGVDAALVHHYFGSKADLFGETIGTPIRPDVAAAEFLKGPHSQLGERIVRFILEAWDRPEVQKRGVVILRAAVGNKMATPLLVGFLSRELLGRIAAELGTPDARLRASLAATQIAGLIAGRYILRFPEIVDAPREELVQWYAPTVQRYLTGEAGRDPS